MTRWLRAIFTKVGADTYGPSVSNPIYEATTADGRIYRVERHQWMLPTRWGWSAKWVNAPAGTTLDDSRRYSDDLNEMAYMLGFGFDPNR